MVQRRWRLRCTAHFNANVPTPFLRGERKPFVSMRRPGGRSLRPRKRLTGLPARYRVMAQPRNEFNAAVLVRLAGKEEGGT
jgi:hypothetical protein